MEADLQVCLPGVGKAVQRRVVHSLQESLEAGLKVCKCVCLSCGFLLTDTGSHALVVGNSHMCNCG